MDICPSLKSDHLILSTDLAVYDTVVTVTTEPGYIMENNTISKALRCLEYGVWNDSVGNITGTWIKVPR